ncbi:hypothetical protein [Mycobacterium intracellulare]|uniref:hypothetical protein n=1 Tax=Mycobacterium intracellulare TaxID=1767 RepID=UPI001E3BC651|nr:hypothetical protein [Mycobacterium intracellulare]
MSTGGAAGGAPVADDVGAGLLEEGTRVDDGAADFGVVVDSLLPSTTSVITSPVTTTAAAPHHGQRGRRGGGGYPPGPIPTAPAG